MNTTLLIIAFIFLATLSFFLLLVFKRKKVDGSIVSSVRTHMSDEPNYVSKKTGEIGCDLALFDEDGVKWIESREIENIPARAHTIDLSSNAMSRVKHLASDLFSGAASIPSKTVEVVFKPVIHQGLSDGTYTLMRTKTGEVLADAVDTSGKIVGKGRLVQGGKARQMASGAFQLVSIAVAQSHLADIERSLSAVKDSISEVLEKQENEDKSRITGAFDYLIEVAAYMKELRCPDELSQQKRNAIEEIIKDSYSWRNKLEEDITSLTSQISSTTDSDTFGTGDTFDKLKSLIEKIKPLLKRRELFLNFASAINFVTAYIDPAQREYSKISINETRWGELIDCFKDAVWNRETTLMGKSFWNSNETLQLRKDKLRSLSSDYHRIANDQQANYLVLSTSLAESMSRLIDPSGNVRIAIAFDDKSNISSAAIL